MEEQQRQKLRDLRHRLEATGRLCGSVRETGKGSCGLTDLVSLTRSLKIKSETGPLLRNQRTQEIILKKEIQPIG